jgi:hypothetical protein
MGVPFVIVPEAFAFRMGRFEDTQECLESSYDLPPHLLSFSVMF